METSTESTRVRTGFAMPHPLAVIEQSRRDGREVVGYRVFAPNEDATRWEQVHSFLPVSDTRRINGWEYNGALLSPVYADEVK